MGNAAVTHRDADIGDEVEEYVFIDARALFLDLPEDGCKPLARPLLRGTMPAPGAAMPRPADLDGGGMRPHPRSGWRKVGRSLHRLWGAARGAHHAS